MKSRAKVVKSLLWLPYLYLVQSYPVQIYKTLPTVCLYCTNLTISKKQQVFGVVPNTCCFFDITSTISLVKAEQTNVPDLLSSLTFWCSCQTAEKAHPCSCSFRCRYHCCVCRCLLHCGGKFQPFPAQIIVLG